MTILNGLDACCDLSGYAPALKERGFDFVIRYYSHNPTKNLSRAEALVLSQAGLQIGVVWETAGTKASFFSSAQGQLDGAVAYALAQGGIGQPDGSAIYFAVDYDASDGDIAGPINDYFRGVQNAFQAASTGAVSYQIGVYGSGACCASMLQNGLAQLSWLSQSTGFSGSKTYASGLYYNLIQYLPKDIALNGGQVLNVDLDASNEGQATGFFYIDGF